MQIKILGRTSEAALTGDDFRVSSAECTNRTTTGTNEVALQGWEASDPELLWIYCLKCLVFNNIMKEEDPML